ncbi:MAG: lysoplasmalogenase [Cytophagales bacterium]|nr:MAG: lysoplasmalogenase [Cytophagales bacterium]
MNAPSRVFLLAFCLITILEITGDMLGNRYVHYLFKPLIMGLLLGWVWQQRTAWRGNRIMRWLVAGMVFALLGDVFLMIREVDLFGPGLASFLLMQVCYIAAFARQIWFSGRGFNRGQLLLWTFGLLVYASFFLSYLYTPFHQTPGTNGLWIPVVVYVVFLSSMAIMASLRRGAVKRASYQWVLLGAILFVISDSVIALARFAYPFSGASLVIMATYAAAQYLIVVGVVRTIR